jgi:Rad3-related DNA helicase
MKYETQIDKAFQRLGFTPRVGQREAVNLLLIGFIDEEMQNQILSASTGTGKSVIGAATAEALSIVKGVSDDAPKSSIMLCSTNNLSRQYGDTFSKLEKEKKYIQIKGASNYDCSALYQPEKPENAESCAWYTMVQSGSEFDSVIAQHCNKCEFLEIKKRKNTVRHLTTNYSYFFIDRMYSGKFEDRDLIVWDEAHLINDLFSDHNAIHFSQKRLQQMHQEIADTIGLTDLEISKILNKVTKDCGIKDKINESNYVGYLQSMMKVYEYAKIAGGEEATKALRSNKMQQYTKLSRFTKKYEGLYCKIDDLFKYDYEHVLDCKEEDASVSVKPIFVGTMMEALQCSKHNLFMSATITGDFMTKTLNLDPAKTKFVKLQPTFPRENKEIVFFDPLALNYTSLQNPDVVKNLRKNVSKIVKKHIEDGDNGIILTPSFKLQNEIVSELQSAPWAKSYELYDHRQGEKLEHVLAAFKKHKGKPAVLISPSIFEGVDLPGALSRFQIMVKAPFPSLADKRVKFILDRHQDLFNIIVIMKIIQGFGRSVRSETDFATSYCLDLQGQRLLTSKANIWQDEFTTRFSKFI